MTAQTSPGEKGPQDAHADELDSSHVLSPFLLPPSVVGDLSAYFADMWKLKPKPCDDTDDEEESFSL